MLLQKLNMLLESVDPQKEIFTEEVRAEFVKMFESKLLEKDSEHATQLTTLIESHKQQLVDVTTATTAEFTTKMEQLKESIQLESEQKLKNQDEDFGTKLQEIVEGMDNIHTQKLEKIVEAIDDDRTAKLQEIISMFEQQIAELKDAFDLKGTEAESDEDKEVDVEDGEESDEDAELDDTEDEDGTETEDEKSKKKDAKSKKKEDKKAKESAEDIIDTTDDELVEAVDSFLDKHLDKLLTESTTELSTEIKTLRATKLIEQALNIVSGMEKKSGKYNVEQKPKEVVIENVITSKKPINEAQNLLESKMENCSAAKRMFIKEYTKNVADQELDSKINEAVVAYDKYLDERKQQQLTEAVTAAKSSIEIPVMTPVVLSENTQSTDDVRACADMFRKMVNTKK